jgi:hypothetical protein
MPGSKRIYELNFFRLGEAFPFRDLEPMPTVCLLIADRVEPPYDYDDLITNFLAIGCHFFMTWGEAAERFEDILDETLVSLSLEKGDDGLLSVLTTSHKGESAEDVASFLLESASPDEPVIRCCIGFRGGGLSAREDELRREIAKIVGN